MMSLISLVKKLRAENDFLRHENDRLWDFITKVYLAWKSDSPDVMPEPITRWSKARTAAGAGSNPAKGRRRSPE